MKSFACQNAVSVFVFACAFRPRADRFGPSMLVLSPTRELAQQIQAEVNKYSYKGITSVCVYGGGDRQTQVRAFGKGVEIVIGKFSHNVIRMLKEMYVKSRLSVWYLCTSDVHSHLNTTKQRCFYAPGFCILSLICLSFGFQINISISWKCECHAVWCLQEFPLLSCLATPGRLNDLVMSRVVDLRSVTFLVGLTCIEW